MAERLIGQIAFVMAVDESQVNEDSTFETLETWDSQREVELAIMLEREYGIELSVAEMGRLHSVREIRSVLKDHGVSIA